MAKSKKTKPSPVKKVKGKQKSSTKHATVKSGSKKKAKDDTNAGQRRVVKLLDAFIQLFIDEKQLGIQLRDIQNEAQKQQTTSYFNFLFRDFPMERTIPITKNQFSVALKNEKDEIHVQDDINRKVADIANFNYTAICSFYKVETPNLVPDVQLGSNEEAKEEVRKTCTPEEVAIMQAIDALFSLGLQLNYLKGRKRIAENEVAQRDSIEYYVTLFQMDAAVTQSHSVRCTAATSSRDTSDEVNAYFDLLDRKNALDIKMLFLTEKEHGPWTSI